MVSTSSRFHHAKNAERKYFVEMLRTNSAMSYEWSLAEWQKQSVSCLVHAGIMVHTMKYLSLRTFEGPIFLQSAKSMSSFTKSCGTPVWAVPFIRSLAISGVVEWMIMHITIKVFSKISAWRRSPCGIENLFGNRPCCQFILRAVLDAVFETGWTVGVLT